MFLSFTHIGVAIHIENKNIKDFFEDKYVNQVAVHEREPYIEIVELRDSNLYSKALFSLNNANSVSFMGTDIAYNDKIIIFSVMILALILFSKFHFFYALLCKLYYQIIMCTYCMEHALLRITKVLL